MRNAAPAERRKTRPAELLRKWENGDRLKASCHAIDAPFVLPAVPSGIDILAMRAAFSGNASRSLSQWNHFLDLVVRVERHFIRDPRAVQDGFGRRAGDF